MTSSPDWEWCDVVNLHLSAPTQHSYLWKFNHTKLIHITSIDCTYVYPFPVPDEVVQQHFVIWPPLLKFQGGFQNYS